MVQPYKDTKETSSVTHIASPSDGKLESNVVKLEHMHLKHNKTIYINSKNMQESHSCDFW